MRAHLLTREQRLPGAPQDVFPFFAAEPGVRFVDVQVRGPYRLWHHTHELAPDPRDPGMTLMRDSVRWALPLGPIGVPALPLVRRDLRRIFDYRARRVADLLS